MATKFLNWVDDANVSDNVETYAEFNADTERGTGFQAGTPASAKKVNTALRQANLVASAIMNIVDSTGTLDVQSSAASIQTAIEAKLANANILKKETMSNPTVAQFIDRVAGLQDKLYRVMVHLSGNKRTIGHSMTISNSGTISFADDADIYFYAKKMYFVPTSFGSGSANEYMRLMSFDTDLSSTTAHRPMYMEVMHRVNQQVEANMGYIGMGFGETYSWGGAASTHPFFMYDARYWSYTYSTTDIFYADVIIEYFDI